MILKDICSTPAMKWLLFLLAVVILSACSVPDSEEWKLAFSDSGTGNWTDNWFVEGDKATIVNTSDGMIFSSGPVPGEDASHAVMWTQQTFEGDLRIQYRYTRLDTMTSVDSVNILYILATGLGTEDAPTDIKQSSSRRAVPAMSEYYLNMNAYQISYATTGPRRADYVSARHYPASSIDSFPSETQLPPVYEQVDLFRTGKNYLITAIKEDDQLSFLVEGDNVRHHFVWDTTHFPDITSGRVGLRHMWARRSLYRDVQIFVRKK